MLENLLDEFSMEQTMPLECVSAPDVMLSSSSHSSSSSTHSMSASSHGALVSLAMYSSTSLDMEQLKELIVRMRRIYKEYNAIHTSHSNSKGIQNTSSRFSSISGVIPSSAEDVALCFKEVPDVFFRTDFTLQSLETFTLTL